MNAQPTEADLLAPSVLASDNYSYRERKWRAPEVDGDEEIIFDEPGRVLGRKYPSTPNGGVCCRSHYFRVTKPLYGQYQLRVKHGGGSEVWGIGYDKRTIDGLAVLDSDSRFRMLWVIMSANQEGERRGAERMDGIWKHAAAQKRIRIRKTREGIAVWIDTTIEGL